MRFSDIYESSLYEFVSSSDTSKFPVDADTGLMMNLPKQWSQSPYLGAVKNSRGTGYVAQIHIPQSIWSDLVDGKTHKWKNAPASFFKDTGNQRTSMIVGPYSDPRQAAWIAQEVLYGGNAAEYIEDYFDERYNGGDGSIWRSLKSKVPSFDGAPLEEKDRDAFFDKLQKHGDEAKAVERKQAYEAMMTKKIKRELMALYSANPAMAKKRLAAFGYTGSRNQLEGVIDQLITARGVEFFVTSPGSVKLKNIAALTF